MDNLGNYMGFRVGSRNKGKSRDGNSNRNESKSKSVRTVCNNNHVCGFSPLNNGIYFLFGGDKSLQMQLLKCFISNVLDKIWQMSGMIYNCKAAYSGNAISYNVRLSLNRVPRQKGNVWELFRILYRNTKTTLV